MGRRYEQLIIEENIRTVTKTKLKKKERENVSERKVGAKILNFCSNGTHSL